MSALATQNNMPLVAASAGTLTPIAQAMAPLSATSHLRPVIARFGRGRAWPLEDQRDALAASARLESLPAADELEAHETALQEAAEGPTEPRATMAIIALMIDAYPAARPANPAQLAALYADVLSDDEVEHPDLFSGFQPAVVAAGVRELLRTSKFLPAPAEVHAACTRQRWSAYERWQEVSHLKAIRVDAERVLALACEETAVGWNDEVEF